MKEEQIFNFQIKGIEILETSIKEPKTPINSNTVFGFDIKVEQRFNIEKKLGIITCIINIINNENTTNLGHIKASCLFHIENIDKFIDEKTSQVTDHGYSIDKKKIKNKLLSGMIKDGRIFVDFISQGDISDPEVSLSSSPKSLEKIVEEAVEETTK